MAHRTTEIREYVRKALLDSGAEALQYEKRGRHPIYRFKVRTPSGELKEGMYAFASTPKIDKDLRVIAQAKRIVKTLRGHLAFARDELVAAMLTEGHHEIIAEKVADQYMVRDPVAMAWAEEFLTRTRAA